MYNEHVLCLILMVCKLYIVMNIRTMSDLYSYIDMKHENNWVVNNAVMQMKF